MAVYGYIKISRTKTYLNTSYELLTKFKSSPASDPQNNQQKKASDAFFFTFRLYK